MKTLSILIAAAGLTVAAAATPATDNPAFASYAAPEAGNNVTVTASYAAPEAGNNVTVTASYRAPEAGNSTVVG